MTGNLVSFLGLELGLGLETCGLGLVLGLDDFRISGLGLGLGKRGLVPWT